MQWLNNSEWSTSYYTLPIVIGSEVCGPSKLVVVTVTVMFVMELQSEVATWKRCLHSPF